jgi:hypothetical protein
MTEINLKNGERRARSRGPNPDQARRLTPELGGANSAANIYAIAIRTQDMDKKTRLHQGNRARFKRLGPSQRPARLPIWARPRLSTIP